VRTINHCTRRLRGRRAPKVRLAVRIAGAAAIMVVGHPAAFGAGAAEKAAILPVEGLVITYTARSTLLSAQSGGTHGYNDLDQETWTSVQSASPQEIVYKVRLAAPTNQQANAEAQKFQLYRRVRREDLVQSNRMTLLYGSTDPETYAGQTFAETSAKTLRSLESGTDVPFVLGVNAYTGGILDPALGQLGKAAPSNANDKGNPLSSGTIVNAFMMLGTGRVYYRGTLHRAESGPITVSVLVNGVRTNLPAIHASGTFSFPSKPDQHAEFWWLDSPEYPLTLKWIFANTNSLVTRIDLPDATAADGNHESGQSRGRVSSMEADLGGKACRVELSGIYFNTGSAQLLEESQPTLKAVAEVVKQSKDAVLTIEGHTDNIGSADYNQDLSEKRAAAVRRALVSQFGVPAEHLAAKGYGLTRPVETNDTLEGRARNRRVELARPCAAGH